MTMSHMLSVFVTGDAVVEANEPWYYHDQVKDCPAMVIRHYTYFIFSSVRVRR